MVGLLSVLGSACGASSSHSSGTSITTGAATVATCPAASLALRPGQPYVSESVLTEVLTNSSSSSCRLSGDPSLTLLRQDGSELEVTNLPPTEPPKPPVALPPGESATLFVSWSNWCETPPGILTISIALSARAGTLKGPFNGPFNGSPGLPDNYVFTPKCLNSSSPSTLAVVHAYLAGSF